MASHTAACQWAPRCRAMSKVSRTNLASSGLLLFFSIRTEMLHSHLLHLSFTALLFSGMDESAVVWQPHIIDTQWGDACIPMLPYRVATAAESIFFHMSEFRAEGPGLSNGTSSAAQQPQQDASTAAPHLEEQPLPEVHLQLLLRTMQHVWPQYLFPQGPKTVLGHSPCHMGVALGVSTMVMCLTARESQTAACLRCHACMLGSV